MLSPNLETQLEKLRARRADNKTLPPQRLKPKNEDLIMDVALALADEVDRLRKRVQELEDR
jgi:hypothetical protein